MLSRFKTAATVTLFAAAVATGAVAIASLVATPAASAAASAAASPAASPLSTGNSAPEFTG
ncbi:MAG: hypothetical protein QOJ04_3472, partial [Caballeronia sp.]|nr:hypothetical protein [Caballeronia sp.]